VGRRIAFWTLAAMTQVYTVNGDGSGLHRLTDGAEDNYSPAWSPDGRRLAYVRNLPSQRYYFVSAIYVMNADGSGKERLTRTGVLGNQPAWSPDGRKLAFSGAREIGQEIAKEGIYVINPAPDSVATRVTAIGCNVPEYGPGQSCENPTWQPAP